MKLITVALSLFLACMTAFLTSCGSGGGSGFISENKSIRGYNPGVGPFDSNGNYVERWADDKRKGRWWRKGKSSRSSAVAETEPDPTPTLPISLPPKAPAIAAAKPSPPIASYTPPQYPSPNYTKPSPKRVVKQQPKPTIKATPKRKPPIRYTVRQGDTLWSLSRKYNTSVATIQTANGLKNNTLKIGSILLIPQY